MKIFIFENLLPKKRLKGGISIYADFGPPRYLCTLMLRWYLSQSPHFFTDRLWPYCDYFSKTYVKRFLNKVKPFYILLTCNGLEKWREIVCYYLVVSRYVRPVIFFRSLVGLLWTCRIKARPISFKDVHESCSLANLNSNAYIFRVGLFFVSWCPIS